MRAQQPFPKDFLWGASTASHQVEGNTLNQWSVWELENAAHLAKTAKTRLGWLKNWPDIEARATRPDNYVSGQGVDHYNRYEADFDLVKQLNLNAFRFGIEWSRIEPQPGEWDEAEVEHYRRYIQALKARGIEPVLNIWHWTMPTWFTDMGGFERRSNLKYFDQFVEKVAREFGKDVRYFLTVNEPNVYASLSYLTGEWPPQQKKYKHFLAVYWNLTRAHRHAYVILKQHNSSLRIGFAMALANIQAKRPHNLIDQIITKWMRYFWNWWFINRTKKYQDFVGINYYMTDYYKATHRSNPLVPINDMGWYLEPEGLYPLMLRAWARYKIPIMVTENGLADESDDSRRWWLEETVVAMERALSEGIEVIGYLHWSLLDNFEWAHGWWPKFGLVAVDREHGMKRIIRPSARWFGDYLAELRGLAKPPSSHGKRSA